MNMMNVFYPSQTSKKTKKLTRDCLLGISLAYMKEFHMCLKLSTFQSLLPLSTFIQLQASEYRTVSQQKTMLDYASICFYCCASHLCHVFFLK